MNEPTNRARLGLVTDLADHRVRNVCGRAVLNLGDELADVDAAIRQMVDAGWVRPDPDDRVYQLTDLGQRILTDGLP